MEQEREDIREAFNYHISPEISFLLARKSGILITSSGERERKMKNVKITICSVVALVLATAAQAAGFTLTDNQHLDVTTYYLDGYLYDYSSANILEGGMVESWLRAYDTSTVGVSGGSVEELYAYDTSSVDISGGNVNYLCTYNTSNVDISGGSVNLLIALNLRFNWLDRVNITDGSVWRLCADIEVVGDEHFSLTSNLSLSDLTSYGIQTGEGTVDNVLFSGLSVYDSSTVNISGGSVGNLNAYDSSSLNMSGGSISVLYADNLRFNRPDRVNITDGSVGNLIAYIEVVGDEHFSLTPDLSLSDLTSYGIQAAEGMVGNFSVRGLTAYDNSTLDVSGGSSSLDIYNYNSSIANISGGSVNALDAYDSSSVNISDGSIDGFDAYDSSSANISGGSVDTLEAYDTSAVDISGGSIGSLKAYNLRFNWPNRLNITDGSVGTLSAYIEVVGDEHFSLTSNLSLSDLTFYGIQAAEGTVGKVYFGCLTARDTSIVNISNASVSRLLTYNTSSVDISSGTSYGNLSANDSSTMSISGGSISNYLSANDSSTVNISSGSFGSFASAYFPGTVGLSANDSSTVNMSGGSISKLYASHNSVVNISGGSIGSSISYRDYFYAYDNSIVNMSGGHISNLRAYDSSTVSMSGGSIGFELIAYDSSTVNISGGSISSYLSATGSSIVNIFGGSINKLYANATSNVIFNGYDFALGNGLYWDIDGKTILGTGILSGKWFDDTSFAVNIYSNQSSATITTASCPPADSNGDFRVDFVDFAIMAELWDVSCYLSNLAIMAEQWLEDRTVTVPDVLGMNEEDAKTEIINLKLVLGTVSYAYSDVIAVGNIISQNPTAGENVPPESVVDLVVFLGPIPLLDITWVYIDDTGVSGHEGFTGYMSKYETTNAQYAQYLNSAKATGDITVNGSYVVGASSPYSGQNYYLLGGSGYTFDGATSGGASRINYTQGSFTFDSGFENHPVTYVSWYGATAFASYYGWRLPTEWEWQAVADYDGSYNYGCGITINNDIANYRGSTHPNGTTDVGEFGTYGYGMADMTGNVWEWTSSLCDPQDSYRIICSGQWYISDSRCMVSYRSSYYPDSLSYSGGFRVCR